VLVDDRPSGLVLIFALEPAHPVDRLEVSGATGIPAQDLERQIREAFGGVPTLAQTGDVAETVRRLLRNEGYRRADVAVALVPFHDPHRATMAVRADAGARTTVTGATVRGQSKLTPEQVLARLRLAPGSPFRERALAADLASLRDELRGQGFYTAIAQFIPTWSPDESEVAIAVTVDAGPLVELRVNGELPGSTEDLIPIRAAGSVDADLLDDARAGIETTLRRRGHRHARVTYTQARPAPDRLLITFDVVPGKRYRVVRVDLPAGLQATDADMQQQPALKTGAWFSQEDVLNALLIIKAQYQMKGFHRIVMDPRFDEVLGRSDSEGGIVVNPVITEGPRAVVARIVFNLGEQPAVTESMLRARMNAREQAPYVPAHLALDTRALEDYYESQGFLNRLVELRVEFNPAGTEAVFVVFAREGPRITVGDVTVIGNERLSREEILREITLRPGEPYSEAARVESQRRLYNLSSFRSVRITAQPRLPGQTSTRIVISVEEASALTLGYGGGLEAGTYPRSVEGGGVEDYLAVSPRVFIEVGRRNLGGRNRALTLFGRLTAKPKSVPGDPEQDGQGFGFAEYRASVTYTERFAFRSNATVLIGASTEQAVRTSYNFARRLASAAVTKPMTARTSLSTRYSLESTRLFDERISEQDQPLIDRLYPQVRISMLSASVIWDNRDGELSPLRGGQFVGGVDFAPEALGSEVGFVKMFVQASIFRPVLPQRRLILAGRVQLGLAHGFERETDVIGEDGQPVLGPGGQPLTVVVTDLPASHRFFAGGSTTVRGFQLDRLGVREILDDNGLSSGGNGLILFNGEARVGVGRIFGRDLAVVGFVDAGNVFQKASDLSLPRMRATLGFGARYDSPIGPLRLDFGFKTDKFLFANYTESRWEFHFSLGEVF
jgi:outer membrane protein assembly factor BamA